MNVSRIVNCRVLANATKVLPSLIKKQPNDLLILRNPQTVPCFYQKARLISTVESKDVTGDSLLEKILKKIPFLNIGKSKARVSAYLLYESIADKINYVHFFDELDMPDTFYSWFVITELHIWMLSVRSMADGEEGRFLRNCLVEALWGDVAQRVKKIGAANPSDMRLQVLELSQQLQAALIAYDEGLQSDDYVLAGALWRRFYQQKEVDLEHLDKLVHYIRKQVRYLDHLSTDQIIKREQIVWDKV